MKHYSRIDCRRTIIKGANRDTAWYTMLDTEWPDRKRAFEEWLSPSNFDAAGRQKRTLAEMRAMSHEP